MLRRSITVAFSFLSVLLLMPSDAVAQQAGDSLPTGAIKRFGTYKFRHGSRILCARYSPNGRILAAGGGSDPVRLWDTDTGKEIRQCKATWVTSMVFSPRGSVLITADAFQKIRFFETATGTEFAQLKGHKASIRGLVMSPDGTMLASADQDGLVILWELITRKEITRFHDSKHEINALAFSPNSSYLATGGIDRTIRVYDVDNGRFKRDMHGWCSIYALAFLDNDTLASGGDDQQIRTWNINNGNQLDPLGKHSDTVVSLIRSSDGNLFISGGRDKNVYVWDLAKRQLKTTIQRWQGDVDALALSRDGRFIAAGGLNHVLRRWETATGKEVIVDEGHRSGLVSVATSPDGKFLATGTKTGTIRLWDYAKGQVIRKWETDFRNQYTMQFSPDGKSLAVGGGNDGIILQPTDATDQPQTIKPLPGGNVMTFRYSPDGKYMAIGYGNQGAIVCNVRDKQIAIRIKAANPVRALAYTPNGDVIAVADGHHVGLWDTLTGQQVTSFGPKDRPLFHTISSLAFAPDGKTLAVGSYDATVKLWNTKTGKAFRTMEGHTAAVLNIAFSFDGRSLASAGFDGSVRLWEAFSGNPIAIWKGHFGPVTSVAFSVNGRVVISGSTDTSLLFWDVTMQSPDGTLPSRKLTEFELRTIWRNLPSTDSPSGHRSLWQLVSDPDKSIAYLKENLTLIDRAVRDKHLANLNAKRYVVREKATKALKNYGVWIMGNLREGVKKPPSEEVRRRMIMLMEDITKNQQYSYEQEVLRFRRAMVALEQIGTPEAQKLIEQIINQSPADEVVPEAVASLRRLQD